MIEDPNGSALVTDYAYDVLDNLTGVTQGAQTRTLVYNSLSQLTDATHPESGHNLYGYDDAGLLNSRTDARGTVSAYGYDGIHRLASKTYTVAGTTAATPNVTYTYDSLGTACNSKGRLTSVSSSASSTSYSCYDALGRVTQGSQTTGSYTYNFSNYTYDFLGNLTSQTLPSGKAIKADIDAAGRVAGIYKQGGGYYAGKRRKKGSHLEIRKIERKKGSHLEIRKMVDNSRLNG